MMTLILVTFASSLVIGVAIAALIKGKTRAYETTVAVVNSLDALPMAQSSNLPSEDLTNGLVGRPAALVFGYDLANPAGKIAPLSDEERFRRSRPTHLGHSLLGRMNAMLQAAPTVLIDGAHRGRNLMEVVINGDMIRAADGNGLRAIAVDATGNSRSTRVCLVQKS